MSHQKPPKLKSKDNGLKKIPAQNIQGLRENYKKCNIRIMRIPEEKERDNGTEDIFETIMTEFL